MKTTTTTTTTFQRRLSDSYEIKGNWDISPEWFSIEELDSRSVMEEIIIRLDYGAWAANNFPATNVFGDIKKLRTWWKVNISLSDWVLDIQVGNRRKKLAEIIFQFASKERSNFTLQLKRILWTRSKWIRINWRLIDLEIIHYSRPVQPENPGLYWRATDQRNELWWWMWKSIEMAIKKIIQNGRSREMLLSAMLLWEIQTKECLGEIWYHWFNSEIVKIIIGNQRIKALLRSQF